MEQTRRAVLVGVLALWLAVETGEGLSAPAGCSPPRRNASVTGLASWYGPGFHGRITANGRVYDQWGMTAASRTLPLGSVVEVLNKANGRTVVLTITDRGPYVGPRILDLSRGAARRLGVEEKGVARVTITHVGCDPEQNRYRLRGR